MLLRLVFQFNHQIQNSFTGLDASADVEIVIPISRLTPNLASGFQE